MRTVAERVAEVFCVNVRKGRPFAVADAYHHWTDVSEETAIELLREALPTPRPSRAPRS